MSSSHKIGIVSLEYLLLVRFLTVYDLHMALILLFLRGPGLLTLAGPYLGSLFARAPIVSRAVCRDMSLRGYYLLPFLQHLPAFLPKLCPF